MQTTERSYAAPNERIHRGPKGVLYYESEQCHNGYTLFSQAFGDIEYLIDMHGVVVHTWPVEHTQIAELRQDGHLFWDDYMSGLFKSDWDGNVLWSWRGRVHHDFYVRENGNVVTLYQRPATRPDIHPDKPISDDLMLEIAPSGVVEWEWRLSDHLGELVELAGIQLPRKGSDWAHTNTLEVLPDTPLGREDSRFQAGNYLLSHRALDVISIIDHDTMDIIWAWGLGVLDGQHQPTMLENGNILMFDNGTLRGHSIALEIEPRNPKEPAWEYSDPENFFSPYRAGVQRLPNGNTLICESDTGRIFEVTPEKQIVWDYYSPFLADPGQLNHIYRATRYEPELIEPLLGARTLEHLKR